MYIKTSDTNKDYLIYMSLRICACIIDMEKMFMGKEELKLYDFKSLIQEMIFYKNKWVETYFDKVIKDDEPEGLA